MVTRAKMSISIQETLANQADILAQQLNISTNRLVETALADYIRNAHTRVPHVDAHETDQTLSDAVSPDTATQKEVYRGDIFWVQLEDTDPGESGIVHPYVIMQENVLNHSRLETVVACTLTSNIKKADLPGNVLLEAGEASLPKQSVVEVSKVSTLAKTQLGEYIGSLSERRINQILAGMQFLQRSYLDRQ